MMIPRACSLMLVLMFGIVAFTVSLTDKDKVESLARKRRQLAPAALCLSMVNTSSSVGTLSFYGEVLCDGKTDGGGWIVLLKRNTGRLDFNRSWSDYKFGFGDVRGEFWIGNHYLYMLTTSGYFFLRVDMVYKGRKYFAKYYGFKIRQEGDNYRLRIDSFLEGNAGDSLRYHNNSVFSTYDRDNSKELHKVNCVSYAQAPWWYYYCQQCLLFGKWGDTGLGKGINWKTLTGYTNSLDAVEMKIKVDTKWY